MKLRFKTIVDKMDYYLNSVSHPETIVDIALTEGEHITLCHEMGADVTQYRGIKITIMKDYEPE